MAQANVLIEVEYVAEEMAGKKYTVNTESSKGSYLIITLFYLLGTVGFIPHNFYVTANEYWMYKFRDPNVPFNKSDTVSKTSLQKNFTSTVGITGTICIIGFCLLTMAMQNKISIHRRIVGSMYTLLLLMFITFTFVYVDTDSWQTAFFVIALIIGGSLNACSGVLLVTIYQLASKFPARCIAAQLAGQAVCGIVSSLSQIMALAAIPTVTGTAALYYSIAIATISVIISVYVIVLRKSEEFYSKVNMQLEVESTNEDDKRPKFEFAKVKAVFQKMWLLLLCIVASIGASGILHPGLTALAESSSKGFNVWGDTYFVPVSVFFINNTFEFIGRESSNHLNKLKNIYVICGVTLTRLGLFPLILFCNLQPRNHLPVLFHDDAYFIIFMIIFSLTGGYLANVTILLVPEYCKKDERMIGMLLIMMVMLMVLPVFTIFSGILVNVI